MQTLFLLSVNVISTMLSELVLMDSAVGGQLELPQVTMPIRFSGNLAAKGPSCPMIPGVGEVVGVGRALARLVGIPGWRSSATPLGEQAARVKAATAAVARIILRADSMPLRIVGVVGLLLESSRIVSWARWLVAARLRSGAAGTV